MGTNKPVKTIDAKSGLIRRPIDITPSGVKLPTDEYDKLKEQIAFELGAIAYRCREVYLNDPHFYDDYIPVAMIGVPNDLGTCLRMLFDEGIQGNVKTVMNGKHRIEFHIYINTDDELREQLASRYETMIS